MTEPSAPRALGDYKKLLEPFDHTFEQGLAEIPDNIERSRKTIARIKAASKTGKGDIKGFLAQRAGQTREVRKRFRRQKWALRLSKLRYGWARLGKRIFFTLLRLRLFWSRYKWAFIMLIAICALFYGVMAYSSDVIDFVRTLLASFSDRAGGQLASLRFRGGLG
ncbi:hypothetical protein [uncultured Cohaesibacter sp.]|uniref:hypothetical protein n=1 Tax=uncultured Cohaesibacter sp. TaxID=1002546 RepID=UPI002AABB03B|nr:hypothetical protein [uncultured Cohaesibacter sp.]